MRLKLPEPDSRYSYVDVRRSYDFPGESSVPLVEVAKFMSSMKQRAAQVPRDDEVSRLHAFTSASFPVVDLSLDGFWGKQARKPSQDAEELDGRRGSQAGSKPDAASGERRPDTTICRDFGFGTVKAVLRRRLAPQCRVLL